MSEYISVERPFLEKLRELEWEVIDHNKFLAYNKVLRDFLTQNRRVQV